MGTFVLSTYWLISFSNLLKNSVLSKPGVIGCLKPNCIVPGIFLKEFRAQCSPELTWAGMTGICSVLYNA